jgi:hypothetical protein
MAKSSRRNLYRRSSRKNNRKNTRKNRQQRGGASTDGGLQTQRFFDTNFARPEGAAFNSAFSTAPTDTMIRPVLGMSPETGLGVIQGSGSVPAYQQNLIGGRRNKKHRRRNSRKNRSVKKNRN